METQKANQTPARVSIAYAVAFRWGPWLIVLLGALLVAYALLTSGAGGLRIAALTLGTLLVVAGVALPRVQGDVALDGHGFRANMQGIDHLDPSALAAAVTEAAAETLPENYPHKDEFVRELAAKTVQTWGNPEALAGRWWAHLGPHEDEPMKLDLVELKVRGEDLAAEIRRVRPADQSERRWRFQGKVRGSFLFGMFYTTTPDVNALSYGTIQLRRQDAAGTIWTGFYVRLEIGSVAEGWSTTLEPVDLRWERSEPEPEPERES